MDAAGAMAFHGAPVFFLIVVLAVCHEGRYLVAGRQEGEGGRGWSGRR